MKILLSELNWLIPFLCLSAIGATVSRPEPTAPPLGGDRVLTDIRGKKIHIGTPFAGSVLTRGTEVTGYLAVTREPETLVAVTAYRMGDRVRSHTIGRMFPEVVANPRIWATEGISDANGPKVQIEKLLQYSPGVFMGWYTLAEPIERIGLPFVGFKVFPDSLDELYYEDRAYSSVVGKPERGLSIREHDDELFRQLDNDIGVTTELYRPTYLHLHAHVEGGVTVELGVKNHYTRFFVPHVGVKIACACPNFFGFVDAEHILAEDPEIIVLGTQPTDEKPDEFVADPRWRGLTAVARRRVYRAPPGIDYFIDAPFWSRWLAELAHPDIMPRDSRRLYREHIAWLFDYALSEDELDTAFAVKDNHNMANAKRFEAQHHDQ